MAEFKKNFLKGKMNKDLDERLVPNGEYRDALNIEISDSESSNVGSVQNLKGNTKVTVTEQNGFSLIAGSLAISPNAFTVATYPDETNKRIYNFVHKASDLIENGVYNGIARKTGLISDCIFEFNSIENNDGGFSRPVLTDVYEVRSAATEQTSSNVLEGLDTVAINQSQQGSAHKPLGIRVGMRVQKYDLNGNDLWGESNKVYVKKILPSTANNGKVEITNFNGLSYNQVDIDNGVVLRFTSERILNFNDGTEQYEANVSGTPVSPTPKNNIITGINLINDILYFTDNKTEPKKVSLKRFRSSKNSIYEHSIHRWVDTYGNAITEDLKESFITVIKQNPLTPPKIKNTINDRIVEEITEYGGGTTAGLTNVNTGVFYSPSTVGTVGLFEDDFNFQVPFSFSNNANEAYLPDVSVADQPETLFLGCSVNRVNWRIGDLLELSGTITGASATVAITGTLSNNENFNVFEVTLVALSEDYVGTEPAETWNAQLKNKRKVYEDDFVCFAYRYKYVDDEYSAISPYSDIAFVPGFYSYNSLKGFNNGMVNKVQDIKVLDFIPPHTPSDVASIELLFKKTDSTTIHVVESFKRNSSEWNSTGSPGTSYKGNVTISSEVFGKTLPESQTLRIFDNVPIKARSQEVVGSRIMYGNYHENYDIIDEGASKIIPKIDHSFQAVPTQFTEDFSVGNEFSANQENNDIVLGSGQYTSVYLGNTPIADLTPSQGEFDNTAFADASGGSAASHAAAFSTFFGLPTSAEYDPDSNFNNQLPVGTWFQNDLIPNVVDGTAQGPYFEAPISGYYTFSASTQARALYQNYVNYDEEQDAIVFPISLLPFEATGTFFGLVKVDANGIWNNWPDLHNFVEVNSNLNQDVYAPNLNNPDLLHAVPVTNTGIGPGNAGISSYQTYSFSGVQVYLNQGERVAAGICIPRNCLNNGTSQSGVAYRGQMRLKSSSFICDDAPDSIQTVITTQARASVKSGRTYEIGVVYCDKHGRESTVLLDISNSMRLEKISSDKINRLSAQVQNKAPYWAEYYKFYVKEIASKYHNIVLHKAYSTGNAENTTTTVNFSHVWLAFNSADRSKVKIGSYLVQKKRHGNSVPVFDEEAKYRVLDIIGNATIEEDDEDAGVTQEISLAGLDLDALGADFDDVNGKFFVKIEADNNFTVNINNNELTNSFITSDENTNNGAVFEVVDEQEIDLDLFYEVSQAYPINLLGEKASVLIQDGDKITLESGFSNPIIAQFDAIPGGVFVQNVQGAKSLGLNQTTQDQGTDGAVLIQTNQDFGYLFGPMGVNSTPAIIRLTRKDGSYYTLRLKLQSFGNTIRVYPFTHKTSNSNFSSKFLLRFVNCFAFGNGVESDRIRDDFNASTMYPYTAAGKQSGFKASSPNPDYRREHKKNDIIFSQIINEATGSNRGNEFLMAEDIVKRLNPEYGSIQKLFTRNTDLITFCENKILRVLANGKDALFNADGNAQLLSSTNVLGQAIPYLGDYGISENPESFAADEFRCYFTDVNRGAVCRLSRDGVSPISSFGMKDWFYDNLKDSKVCIGSYDGRKDEYNLTIHTNNASGGLSNKNVYTLSFSEDSKGWISFKSFIKESGVSLNNDYYTAKDGLLWLHHSNNTHNNFYDSQYTSTVTTVFNEVPGSVKKFDTINYEGTQARVNQHTSDDQFYNLSEKKGWYVESITTDLQEGKVDEFIDKENKWFNYIQGTATSHTNAADGNGAVTNLDISENTVQGIGQLSEDSISSESGFSEGFDISVQLNAPGENFSSTGYQVYNIDTMPTTGTFIIVPDQGFSIAANQFSITNSLPSWIDSIVFSDTTTAGTSDNTVLATITFAGSISSDLSHSIQVETTTYATTITWEGVVNVYGEGIGNGETVSLSIGDGTIGIFFPIPSGNPNMVSYFVGAYVGSNNGVEEPMITVTVDSGNNYFYSNFNPVNWSFTPVSEVENYEVNNTFGYTPSGCFDFVSTSRTYNIYYNNLQDENIILDDDNTIFINTNSTPVQCEFNSYPEQDGIPTVNYDDNNNLNNINVGLTCNIGTPSILIHDDDGEGVDWITPQTAAAGSIFLGTGGGGPQSITPNSATFNLATNTGAARDLQLRLFSPINNTDSADDALQVVQSAVQTLDLKVQYDISTGDASGEDYSQLYDHLDGFDSALPNSGPKLPPNQQAGLITILNPNGLGASYLSSGSAVVVFTAFASPGNFSDEGTPAVISYQGDTSDWAVRTFNGVPYAEGDVITANYYDTGLASFYIGIYANETSEDRTLTITISHPADSTLTDSVTITQRANYNSENNTLVFLDNIGGQEPNPTVSPNFFELQQFYNSGAVEQVVTLKPAAQTKRMYIKIPDQDFADIQAQHLEELLIDPNADFPVPQVYTSGGVEAGFIDEDGDPVFTIGDGIYAADVQTTTFNGIQWGVFGPANFYGLGLANYLFDFQVTNNDYVIPGNFVPDERSFFIEARHPYNLNGAVDSRIKIVQEPQPACYFANEGETVIADTQYVNLPIVANSGTPSAYAYRYQRINATTNNIIEDEYTVPDWVIIDGGVTSNGNTPTQQDYSAAFTINPPSIPNSFWRLYVKCSHSSLPETYVGVEDGNPEEDTMIIQTEAAASDYWYLNGTSFGNTAQQHYNERFLSNTLTQPVTVGVSQSVTSTTPIEYNYEIPTFVEARFYYTADPDNITYLPIDNDAAGITDRLVNVDSIDTIDEFRIRKQSLFSQQRQLRYKILQDTGNQQLDSDGNVMPWVLEVDIRTNPYQNVTKTIKIASLAIQGN